MNAFNLAKTLIKKHEGLRLNPYKCSANKTTIGYGRNLEDVGISEIEAENMLQVDLGRALADARMLCNTFNNLSDVRQAVLIDMSFNLGYGRLKQFKRMFAAIASADYLQASHEMLNSRWAHQVKGRALTLSDLMKNG